MTGNICASDLRANREKLPEYAPDALIMGGRSFFARKASHWRMSVATRSINGADLSHSGSCKPDVTLN